MGEKPESRDRQTVLLVHNFYQIGGGEHTVFENEKRLLRENGHRVVTFTRSNDELKTSIIKKVLLPLTTFFSLRTFFEVRRVIRREKIDVVHCHNTFPLISPAVYYAARSRHVPVVQTIHNFRFLCPCATFYHDGDLCEDCVNNGLNCAVRKKCYRSSAIQTWVVAAAMTMHRRLGTYRKIRYIFLTDFNREKFRSLLGTQVEQEFIKPNFEYIDVTPAAFDELVPDRFIFIGRLDQNKGVHFLLQAWQQVHGKTLVIYGSGPLEDCVRRAAKGNPSIVYRGFCGREEILRDLRTATALVFTSEWYEGFPMTLVEAFAAGTPVLCSDIGNAADIVRQADAGICYRNRSVENFVWKMDEIASRETNLRLRGRARQVYLARYTPEINDRILEDIYDKVCAKSNG